MKTLSIDIETYSEASLSSTGVYRYAADETFTILLFAYSVDGEPVQIVDLAQGESLPAEVEAALSDPSVQKWAFNAQFERVCLSAYLGERLDPRGWYCSMVWSTYAGIPLNLAGVAQALHLETEKMTEGKDLIRKFSQPCKATKTNGGRTRNLPEHAMEDWETFKAYCIRDVEVERAIASRLAALPMPAFEWENYWRDQRFNDLGVGIDVELASKAVEADLEIKEALYTQMKHWTGVENPQSVTQLLGWLQEHGAQLPSLAKADVASALEEADGTVAEVRLGGSVDAVRATTEVDRVHVGADDLVLGLLAVDLDGQDGFLELARVGRRLADVVALHVLLGQRRATLAGAAAQVVDEGAENALQVDAVVRVERTVLGGHDRLRHVVGQRRRVNDLTIDLTQGAHLGRAVGVVDRGLLRERQVVRRGHSKRVVEIQEHGHAGNEHAQEDGQNREADALSPPVLLLRRTLLIDPRGVGGRRGCGRPGAGARRASRGQRVPP